MKLVNKRNNQIVVEDLIQANNPVSRFFGLMGKKFFPNECGMLFYPCQSIHTFFMRFDIDVILLNKKMEVVKIFQSMKPFRMTKFYFNAYYAVETKSNLLSQKVNIGDILEVKS